MTIGQEVGLCIILALIVTVLIGWLFEW